MTKGFPNTNRGVERLTGLTALLISFLVVSAIMTSLDISPVLVNIHEDLAYLGENLSRLRINTIIWFINAMLIILLGPLILMSFLPHGRSASYLAAFLISTTGILYLIYAVNGYNMTYMVEDYLKSAGQETDFMATLTYEILLTNTNLQLAIYSLAGLSSIILGILIARTGHLPRFIGWLAILGGINYASFGWVSVNNILFTAGRLMFIIALLLLGAILLLRGTKDLEE